MDNSLVQKVKEELGKSDSIVIAVGKDPTIDEMAAALSLYLLLKEANKKVTVACPTQPIVELSNLVGIDKVVENISSQEGDLVVAFPYVEGEIEKVSYTLENGLLNIIVKASSQGLSFDEKDVRYSKGGSSFDLLVVIGTPVLSELEGLIDSAKLSEVKIINIDNKQENQGYGDIVAVSPSFSSVSEQIADLMLALGVRIDRDVAQNLLSGITYATKNFQDSSTSPLAFEIASLLMRNGAQRVSITSSPRQPIQRHDRDSKTQDRQSNRSSRFQRSEPQEDQRNSEDNEEAPNDWLSPKVYKGSSNF